MSKYDDPIRIITKEVVSMIKYFRLVLAQIRFQRAMYKFSKTELIYRTKDGRDIIL